jgi:predicted RNA-binding Zn-ribbon protein involved in translation (DUF1610 family)
MKEEAKEVCSVCGGKGYIEDAEPQDYVDEWGNIQIRFKPSKLPCPNCGQK